jgi:hypothetical protein
MAYKALKDALGGTIRNPISRKPRVPLEIIEQFSSWGEEF